MKPPKVFKRPGSPFYWYRLFSGGRETWHSTEQKTKEAAEAIATDARKAQKGEGQVEQYFNMLVARLAALPAVEQAEIRQRFARRLMMRSGATVSTTDAWQAWLDSPQKGNPGERTRKGYSAIWHRFKMWADKKQLRGLHEISPFPRRRIRRRSLAR